MWLLNKMIFRQLASLYATRTPTVGEVQAYNDAYALSRGERGGPLIVEGSTGVIEIDGLLTPRPDFFAFLLGIGNTVYTDIQAAALQAEADPKIKDIVLAVSSPGGNVSGLFETIDALDAITKPMRAEVNGAAASAAYALASQADTITALNRSAQIGSLGTMMTLENDSEKVVITSTNAPNKSPDPTTEEGKAVIRAELDSIHDLFVDAIATGRGTTVAKVNSDFGRGAVLLAAEAEKQGMIDGVAERLTSSSKSTASTGGQQSGAKAMTLEELRAQHPALFAQLRAEGFKEGVKTERDRVVAHLAYGAQSPNYDKSVEAIKAGNEVTPGVVAEYQSSIMAGLVQKARQSDDDNLGDSLDNLDDPDPKLSAKKEEAKTVALAFERMGLEAPKQTAEA